MVQTSRTQRKMAPEADALRLGCGWRKQDLEKPWVMVESTAGDSHPGSVHLGQLSKAAEKGVIAGGGACAHYTCTDICDGVSQGTEGMYYSLPSREVITMAVEAHARAGHYDGMVLLAGCDKSSPAHLIAATLLNIPTVVVPGGVMESGPDGFTLEGVGTLYAKKRRGELSEEDFLFYQGAACPSVGSCAFFGTAATMQMLAEVLGFAMPNTALIPAHLNALQEAAQQAGHRLSQMLSETPILPHQLVTEVSLRNALVIMAATGGSTNAFIHLAAIARVRGIPFPKDEINRINEAVPFILNLKPSGKFTADKLWYAGGVPRLMLELRAFLDLDALTVSGLSWGETLEILERTGHFEKMPRHLATYGGTVRDLIADPATPLQPTGAHRVLTGNIAPEGAVIKVSALAEPVDIFEGIAKVYDDQHSALEAVFKGEIQPGDVLVIRYEGPAASGMPEQFYVTEAIASHPILSRTVMLLTDGRFSGATRGPAIAHVSPEANRGGPIALLHHGDRIRVDLKHAQIDMVGDLNGSLPAADCQRIFEERKQNWQAPSSRCSHGLLGVYTRNALSPWEGGGLF